MFARSSGVVGAKAKIFRQSILSQNTEKTKFATHCNRSDDFESVCEGRGGGLMAGNLGVFLGVA